jgi:hypothetical protein
MVGFEQTYGLVQCAAQIASESGDSLTGGELCLTPSLMLWCLW